MKVVLLASGPFAVPALDLLHAGGSSFELCGVVCRPARPAGRGRKTRENPVKTRAQELGITCLTPPTVNTPEFCEELRSRGLDVLIVADYGELLREEVLSLPPLGAFNIHASILPSYRGAAPVVHALLNGEKETGVTLFRIERGLDSGPVVACLSTEIAAGETAGELEERLAMLGARLLARQLPLLATGEASEESQDESCVTLAPKIRKADGRMNWKAPAHELLRRIRAFTPWPGAFTELPAQEQRLLKIWEAEVMDGDGPAGEVIVANESGVVVACGEQALRLTTMQRDGGKRMTAADFLRGCPLKSGVVLGGAASATP